MEFKDFNALLMKHVAKMTAGEKFLYVVGTQRGELWKTYLDSFPDGTNKIFRERREFDCNCCHNFIRDIGNVVAVDVDHNIVTIWDFETGDSVYQPVVDALATLVRSKAIREVFLPTTRKIGTQSNLDSSSGTGHRWYHFYAVISNTLKTFSEDQVGTVRGQMRDTRNVLKRSFDELNEDAIITVQDLIAQNSLYKGEEWDVPLTKFMELFRKYHAIEDMDVRDRYCWTASVIAGPAIARIRNHSIGVLLTDIADGMALDIAVAKYEKIVAPSNYKRRKGVFTKKMIEAAQKTVQELGLEDSLPRRHAHLSDVSINDILFANRASAKEMKGNVFDDMAAAVPEKKKHEYGEVEEIGIEKFVNDVLPTVTEMEILLENNHGGNMVSLIAPVNADAKPMFKWNNAFSWAYQGNITDSMKERVKAMGGNVEGELRFSIQWNEAHDNNDDLDAHCLEPNRNLISYPKAGNVQRSSGVLDVDIRVPGEKVAVENIIWTRRANMPTGRYKMMVHNFAARGAASGFTAEIEFDGKIYSFTHSAPLRRDQMVTVAEVIFDGKEFTIDSVMPSEESSREFWGMKTNTFHSVSTMMYSPNFWEKAKGTGHRHFFFMLNGCKTDETPNGFFNEFLNEDLSKHGQVFEALGSKMRVEPSDEQLSGVGFSATKRASLTCKINGSFKRMIKIIF